MDDNDSRITALEAALAAHITDSANPHAVTKAQIDLANVENIKVNYSAIMAPTVDDDINSGYSVGSVWIDVTFGQAYVLVKSTPASAIWKPVTKTYAIGQAGSAVGTGAQNTADIVAGCADASTAAKVTDTYVLNGYGDWFLPSKDELNLLYLQRAVVGGFTDDHYWSSSEYDSNNTWGQYFYNGDQRYSYGKSSTISRVRAVRAF